MTATVAQLNGLAPEFSAIDTGIVQVFLDVAANFVNTAWWGSATADIVQCWYAAHLMKSVGTDTSGGSSSEVSSETLGPLSVSYQSPAASIESDDTLGTTVYGRQIRLLMQARKLKKGAFILA